MAEVKNIQPDNDVFCSVYRKDFVFWNSYKHASPAIHFDSYRMTPEMRKLFLSVETKADLSKMEQYIEETKELNKLRLRTTYRLDYIPKASYKIIMNVDPEKFAPKNDKFLIDGEKQFGVPTTQVLSPLPSARRVLGYSTYNDYRTPLSVYQDVHGRLGYDRFKQSADSGYWRMGPRYDHAKEMVDIKAILRREDEVKKRETEETQMEEMSMRKQLEEERKDLIKRSIEKRAKRIRRTVHSSRFGSDPRNAQSLDIPEPSEELIKNNGLFPNNSDDQSKNQTG